MPHLDVRLRTVAQQIRADSHADIGSDHGHLLVALIRAGRIGYGIAVENKQQPFKNSQKALRGLNAETRLGDGFAALSPGEIDSVSICGMGGETILRILRAGQQRLPERLVLQPNRRPELLRRWAFENSYHLVDEQIAWGHWPYAILCLQRSDDHRDTAYDEIDPTAAFLFGPLLIRRWDRKFVDRLREERQYLRGFDRLGSESAARLSALEQLLANDQSDSS